MNVRHTAPEAVALSALSYGGTDSLHICQAGGWPCWPKHMEMRGETAEGQNRLEDALATVHKTGERWWEAEVHRVKGELLLVFSAEKHAEVETCFHQGLAIARHQQAKSLELRAAMSLARLWQHQGKPTEARELLAPIYGWFTEGFDTADLQEAKALLEAMRTER